MLENEETSCHELEAFRRTACDSVAQSGDVSVDSQMAGSDVLGEDDEDMSTRDVEAEGGERAR